MRVCNCSMFCCTLLYVHSSIAIILMGKRELVAFLYLSSWCLLMVERLFLAVPWGCLRFVIVVFPKHTHLLFQALIFANNQVNTATEQIPLQDFSTQAAVQETVDAVNSVETILQTLMDLPDVKNTQTQTEGLNLRELQGLDKVLQSIRGELFNNLAKMTDIDKDIAKEKRKLGEAEDEISKKRYKSTFKQLRR